jgi:hypothetical protein
MKEYFPTYLYIKTHNVTGLKYFGKTTGDPYRYYGSGRYWISHLKKHGYNVSTDVIGLFYNKEECVKKALEFSEKNKIVESKEWANLIVENGLDGGFTGHRKYKPMSEETKRKMSIARKGRTPWNKGLKGIAHLNPGNRKPTRKETKEKIRKARARQIFTQETREKMSKARKGKPRPEAREWLVGRKMSEETKQKIGRANKGRTLSEEQKQKIREARAKQIFTEETKQKLKGMIVVIDKEGKISKIDKDTYYSQPDIGDDRTYVFHNCAEGKRRKQLTKQ